LLSSKQDSHVLDPELAESYRKLERLSGTVDVLQKNCARFMELGVQLTEAGLTLANEVSEFYSNSDLDSRQKSVKGFVECQSANHKTSNEELRANLSGQGALAEFSTWSEELAIAKSKVDECQRAMAEETLAARRLVSLREHLRKKRDKTGLFAFGATNCEILEIEQKIPQLESQHRRLAQKTSSLKIEVDQITKRIVANRFDTFDAIFASLMETQMDFYSRCNGEARKLEPWINNYRRQYPKRRLSNANPYVELSPKTWRQPATSPFEKGATTPEPEIVAGLPGVEVDAVDMDVKEDVKEDLPIGSDAESSRGIPAGQAPDQNDLSISNPRQETQTSVEESIQSSHNDFPSTKDLLGLGHGDLQPELKPDQHRKGEAVKTPPTDMGTMDFLFLSPETEAAAGRKVNKPVQSFDFLNTLVSKKEQEHHSPLNTMNDQEINPSLLDDVTHDDLSMFLEDPVPRVSKVKVQRSDSHGDEIMRGFGKKGAPKRLRFSEREQKEIAVKMEQSKREYEKRLKAERNIQVAYEGELSKVEARLNKWEYMGREGKQRRNIRNLLSTLHTVLWPDTSWTPVAVSGLITKKKIKDAYRAAILEVHPDKHTKDPLEVQAVSSRTFEALNEAFNDFRQQNR